jgi:dipeptidyl aminopeptidase/acylaminoacyl peptidase
MKNRDVPLIPRQALFGNPDRASVQVSPDGTHLSWLAPLDGVLNVWVSPRDDLPAARPVTRDTGRGIRSYLWAYTGVHLLYVQDKNGDENWRLYVVDLQSDAVQDLTPFEGVQSRLVEVSPKHPAEVIVGLNQRHPQWHDLYRVNLVTSERTILLQHDRFTEVGVDDDYRLRYAAQMTPDGGTDLYVPAGDDWQLWDGIPAEDALTTSPVGFDKANRLMYMQDSRGRDTSALVELNLETREQRLLAEDPRADVANVVQHPTERHVQAVSFIYDRKRWHVLDPSIEPDLAYLGTVADGDVEIVSRTLDDAYWVVLYLVDDGPIRFYLYDRNGREARFLFTNRQALEGLPLVHMHPVVIAARDGLNLVAY